MCLLIFIPRFVLIPLFGSNLFSRALTASPKQSLTVNLSDLSKESVPTEPNNVSAMQVMNDEVETDNDKSSKIGTIDENEYA